MSDKPVILLPAILASIEQTDNMVHMQPETGDIVAIGWSLPLPQTIPGQRTAT